MFHRFLLLLYLFTYPAYSLKSFQFLKRNTNEAGKYTRDIPVYMWDIYNNGVNSSEIDVVKGIFPQLLRSPKRIPFYHNHKKTEMIFNIPETKEVEILVKAEIRLTTKKRKRIKNSLQFYLSEEKWNFLDEKRKIDSDWVSLEITSKLKNAKSKSIKFLIVDFGENNLEVEPVLLMSYYTQEVLSRKKRSLEEEYEEKTNRIWEEENRMEKHKYKSSCRRKPLYIRFSDIDYDNWIVAPSGYEAFQCVGKCTFPVSEHLSPTKHAILQTLLHNFAPSKTHRACCVPTKLEPISILYIDNNGVLTYRFRYQDMVVSECGCR